MKVNVKQIYGNWDLGFALDKHKISSTFTGNNEWGRPTFDTLRTEAGEATFQLKYRQDWTQAAVLAKAVQVSILPRLGKVGIIIPMAASTERPRQPVSEVASELSKLIGEPSFDNLLLKAKGGKSLKDLTTKQEKLDQIAQAGFSIACPDPIGNEGRWNVLLLDDLFDTGASTESAVTALRTHPKLGQIFVAALTWK